MPKHRELVREKAQAQRVYVEVRAFAQRGASAAQAGVLAPCLHRALYDERERLKKRGRVMNGNTSRNNFMHALNPVLCETHPELFPPHKRGEMICVVYGIWTELSTDEQARWAGRA